MKSKQRGYYNFSMTPLLVAVAIISAVGGWALIEGIIWIFKHITIGWSA
ncbi:hypothetical protein QO209_16795 [Pseudomonas citronellolis]|nr:hypothetical protein [Pseudomonas citronellolis]MDN6874102.1 hypothetical protein [Pseudomonas citronellolis]